MVVCFLDQYQLRRTIPSRNNMRGQLSFFSTFYLSFYHPCVNGLVTFFAFLFLSLTLIFTQLGKLVYIMTTRQSKVSNVYASIFVNKNISGLQIAMKNMCRVHVAHSAYHLVQYESYLVVVQIYRAFNQFV